MATAIRTTAQAYTKARRRSNEHKEAFCIFLHACLQQATKTQGGIHMQNNNHAKQMQQRRKCILNPALSI
jgi:hypothetical protein